MTDVLLDGWINRQTDNRQTDGLKVGHHDGVSLTVVDPITQVAFPPPLVQEGHKGVYVGATGPAAHDGVGRDDGQLLRRGPGGKRRD